MLRDVACGMQEGMARIVLARCASGTNKAEKSWVDISTFLADSAKRLSDVLKRAQARSQQPCTALDFRIPHDTVDLLAANVEQAAALFSESDV